MGSDGTSLNLGAEEEFHVVDLESRRPVPDAPVLLQRLPSGSYAGELHRNVVESNSGVCETLDELRDDLSRLRRQLVTAAEGYGLGIVAAGTIPLLPADEPAITSTPRFRRMLDDYQVLVREQRICGAQVHVGMPDRDMAVAVAQRVTPWLPVLLAISANSPFWAGRDSGYASVRSLVWSRWPTAGYGGPIRSAAEYDELVADLVATGVVTDPGMIYFDVRPSAHVPTIELRVCDACPNLDDVILLAGLFRALVRRERDAVIAGEPPIAVRAPLHRAAMWRAARSGLSDDLVDPATGRPMPAESLVTGFVGSLREQLEAHGDVEQVSELLADTLGRGDGAARQRAAYASRGWLTDVVDMLLADTRTRSSGQPHRAPVRLDAGRATLLADYQAGTTDEAVLPDGTVGPTYARLLTALEKLGPASLHEREADRDDEQRATGVTFRVTGDDHPRLFPVDLVPRVVPADQWALLREGLTQRARALDLFLRDVYDDRRAIHDGIVPAWVVDRSPGLREAGRQVPHGITRAHIAGVDLVLDGDTWRVLEDNLRVPSGLGYALQARRLTDTVSPDLPRPVGLLSGDDASALLRRTLEAAAPDRRRVGRPRIVLLNDGPANSATFEHSLLAAEMGVPIVQSRNLVVDEDGVRLRGSGAIVDVIYLRLDEDDLDGLPSADGSPLGPGLLNAVHRRTVAVANAPGNGVGDDKALYAFVPKLIEYYLGEKTLLEDVPTYLCGDPDQLDHVMCRLGELVLKPVDGFGGAGVCIGPHATEEELETTRSAVLQDPHLWIAQEMVSLSTHPTFEGDRLVARHVDLRAFVCLGQTAEVATAALTRVAPPGSRVVNSSRGGGAKDTWLLGP